MDPAHCRDQRTRVTRGKWHGHRAPGLPSCRTWSASISSISSMSSISSLHKMAHSGALMFRFRGGDRERSSTRRRRRWPKQRRIPVRVTMYKCMQSFLRRIVPIPARPKRPGRFAAAAAPCRPRRLPPTRWTRQEAGAGVTERCGTATSSTSLTKNSGSRAWRTP